MSAFTSWRPLAAVAGASLLAACAYQQPPVASVPPPVSNTYQVSFDTGRWDIDPDAQMTIASIGASVPGDSRVIVTVVGKADTVGNAKANMALSQKRAHQVAEALVATGRVPASSIDIRWTGENQLNVPTGQNVAERRNRSVTVTVQTAALGNLGPTVPSGGNCYDKPEQASVPGC